MHMRAREILTNCGHNTDMSNNDTFIFVISENRKTLYVEQY